jgi:ribosomal protein S18 acetylase RimI-like enzyme
MAPVRRASTADRASALATITAAFAADPVVRWFFSDDATYPARATAFFGFLFDVRVAVDGAWVTEGAESAALWSPPGPAALEWEDRSWAEVAAELEPDEIARCDRWDAAVAPHHPDSPHWYLGVLATAPTHQGRGLGPAVARPGIEAAAAAGLPAFLETGVEDNVALYERMGFVVTGVIDAPDLPPGWCMRRDPQRPD